MDFVEASTRTRVQNCISEVIAALSRNMLECEQSIRIEGFLAVTVDEKKVALVNVNESAIGPPKDRVEYISVRNNDTCDTPVVKMVIPEVVLSSSVEKPKRKTKKWRDARFLNNSGSDLQSEELNNEEANGKGQSGRLFTKDREKFYCRPCRKTFRNRVHLKNHEKVCRHYSTSEDDTFNRSIRQRAESSELYYCKICNKTFTDRHSYTRDYYIHANARVSKSIACSICNLTFENMRVLDEHLQYEHKNDDELKDETQYIYTCEKCEEIFKMKEDYDNHLASCESLCSSCGGTSG
ncbi:unnamed protein product [Dimorphilus gyrociliatus]|uniref:C2H2-type domain-containing protein n=1 Tax=Dimorphilus gyrociliatus TaxID=2664684 RepID=A0A7I8W2V0_9ANNE|nr:unnamed protein product [Dimorphilus gyrociliatus]